MPLTARLPLRRFVVEIVCKKALLMPPYAARRAYGLPRAPPASLEVIGLTAMPVTNSYALVGILPRRHELVGCSRLRCQSGRCLPRHLILFCMRR